MTEAQLTALITVAECNSFTIAAMQMGISQSAVSHAIKQLEKVLNVKLLERRGAEVVLTEVGENILCKSREVVGLYESIRQEAANVQGLKTGTLRIGSFGPSASLRLIPDILSAFHAKYPGIDVHINEGNDQDVLRWLQEHRVDVGFVVLPENHFDSILLATDQMVAVLPKTHPLSDQASIALKDIRDEPFILTGAGSGEIVKSLFARENLTPKIQFRISQVLSMLSYIERGEAVTIMAEFTLPERQETSGYVVRPLSPPHHRNFGLAYAPASQQSPVTKAFIKVVESMKLKMN